MNFCAGCGFKIEGEFNFCPNCGIKLELTAKEALSESSSVSTEEIIVCKNCGEENTVENATCFSCGVLLYGNRSQRPVRKSTGLKNINPEIKTKKQKTDSQKTLDNKKMLIISGSIIAIFVIALKVSGVFDSGVKSNISQISGNQFSDSGVNMANMEEINELENKIAANPEDMVSVLHLAHLLQDSGLFEKAITNYRKYLTKFPDNSDVRVDMGICYYNLGDNDTAIMEMEAALKYNPKHQIAHLNLGIVNLASRNVNASKDWFQKAVDLDPNSEAGKRAKELLNSH